MDHYTPHCYHRGIESFEVPARETKCPTEPIDVRSAKIFCCWVKTDFEGAIQFEYYWDDKKTLIEESKIVDLKAGIWTPIHFGTYRGFSLPAMFLQPQVHNHSEANGTVQFCAISQLQ